MVWGMLEWGVIGHWYKGLFGDHGDGENIWKLDSCGEKIMESLWELDTSKARYSSPAFLRLAQPWKWNSCVSSFVCIQRSRKAGLSCYNLMPFQWASPQPCLLLFIKGPEGGRGPFCLWLLLWAFAFCFGPFGVGSIWKGKDCWREKDC
jgi:hypothetical protein